MAYNNLHCTTVHAVIHLELAHHCLIYLCGLCDSHYWLFCIQVDACWPKPCYFSRRTRIVHVYNAFNVRHVL
jgi:hypothetical protein